MTRRSRPAAPEAWIAVVLAAAMAVMSAVLLRPNPDDWFYVNLSQWVADHGSFPIRDTVFSDLVYPMATWPPTASFDPLAGTVARLLGVDAGTVVYVMVPPIAAALSVLALWRLLRTWRTQGVAIALVLAVTYLLFNDGPSYATPGDLFVTRLWQGKVILMCVMAPSAPDLRSGIHRAAVASSARVDVHGRSCSRRPEHHGDVPGSDHRRWRDGAAGGACARCVEPRRPRCVWPRIP